MRWKLVITIQQCYDWSLMWSLPWLSWLKLTFQLFQTKFMLLYRTNMCENQLPVTILNSDLANISQCSVQLLIHKLGRAVETPVIILLVPKNHHFTARNVDWFCACTDGRWPHNSSIFTPNPNQRNEPHSERQMDLIFKW